MILYYFWRMAKPKLPPNKKPSRIYIEEGQEFIMGNDIFVFEYSAEDRSAITIRRIGWLQTKFSLEKTKA